MRLWMAAALRHPCGWHVSAGCLRVEAGLLLIEVDFNSSKKALIEEQKYSPFEMGLGRLVHLNKNRFIGQAAPIGNRKLEAPAKL